MIMTAALGAVPVPVSRDDARKLAVVTVAVGCWQAALAVGAVLATLAWWPLAEVTSSVQLGRMTLSPFLGCLLLGVAGSVAGSLVHTITIFGSRTGRNTFEASYVWWYLLRPFSAALLGLVVVSAVHSGILVLGGGSGKSGAVMAYITGGLAGMFTDAVLQKLRGVLGATSTEKKASEQSVPLAPSPTAAVAGHDAR